MRVINVMVTVLVTMAIIVGVTAATNDDRCSARTHNASSPLCAHRDNDNVHAISVRIRSFDNCMDSGAARRSFGSERACGVIVMVIPHSICERGR